MGGMGGPGHEGAPMSRSASVPRRASALGCRIAHGVWSAWTAPRARRFRRALGDPEAAQWRVLERILRRNRSSAYGRRHGFGSVAGVEAYRRSVPVVEYDDLTPWIDRIRLGERAVLTAEPVRRLVPSSGSTSACKLVPWTDAFAAEWSRAVQPWTRDLLESWPGVRGGPAYWSVSPALGMAEATPSAVPVGFEEDSAYLGGLLGPLLRSTLAVPEEVRHVRDAGTFRYLTALGLLRAADLRLVSVWHPSFFELLLDAIERHWTALVRDVEHGTVTPPVASPEASPPLGSGGVASDRARRSRRSRALLARLRRRSRPDPARARELERAGPTDYGRIWPGLALLSCWADGPSAGPAEALRRRLGDVRLQAKGLLATEGAVTVPFGDARPVAVRSHFLEFVDAGGGWHTVADLRQGESYGVLLTTGAGLYRYRLGDRVRVEGFLERTPCLRFVGKEDGVSDLRGEKLNGAFVAEVLEELLGSRSPAFSMLAPDPLPGGAAGYTLYLEVSGALPPDLARRLDEALSANPHYRYGRRLDQLRPPTVFRVPRGGQVAYLEHQIGQGVRAGDVKATVLSTRDDWSRHFEGGYEPALHPP